MIDNKVFAKLSYVTGGEALVYHSELKDPYLFPSLWEMRVTNGLGYEKLNHHEDSQEGLIRHLADMEIQLRDESRFIGRLYHKELFKQVLALEDLQKVYAQNNQIILGQLEDISEHLDEHCKYSLKKSDLKEIFTIKETGHKEMHNSPPKKSLFSRIFGSF